MTSRHSTKFLKISRLELGLAAGVLFIVLLAAIVSIGFIGRLQSNYSINQFLPPEHPLLKADSETRQKFFLDQIQPLLITLNMKDHSTGDWLETKRLERLAKVSASLQKLEGATGSLSLATVQSASEDKESLSVGSLLNISSEQERRNLVKQNRFLNPLLVSHDGRRTVVVVSLKEGITAGLQKDLMDNAGALLTREFPEASVSLGGVPAIQTQLSSLVKSEMVRFMGLALLACCLVLLTVFSTTWSVVIPFVAILIANIFVLEFMAAAGISMTVLAVTIPILVSVTVLSLCIHTMHRFHEDMHTQTPVALKSGMSLKVNVVITTLRSLFLPNLLTSLTTCFGFATLLTTNVPVVHDYGFSVAVSIMISWLATTLLIGPLLVILPIPMVRPWVSAEANWSKFIMKNRGWIVASLVIGCSVLALIGQNLHWSARLFDDLPKHEEARRATEEIDQSLGGTIPFDVVVSIPGVSEPWNDPAMVEKLDRVLTRVRVFPEVGSAVGLPDLLRYTSGNGNAPLPSTRAAIAETWFLLSMSPDSELKKYLTPDGLSTRLSLRLRDFAGDRLETIMARIESHVQSAFPTAQISTGGLATTVHRLNDGLSRSLMHGFWEALLVIAVLLAFVFRSLRWTLAAVLPNLVPAAVLVGILALAGTPMKPGVALVFSIALGIAFNNTVYLLQRLRSLMKETGKGPGEAIDLALSMEGNPCMVASLCLLAGFGTFLLSDFGINQTFGVYMLISLFFGLIGDLAFLPALIKLCPWILVSTGKPSKAKLTLNSSEDEMRNMPGGQVVSGVFQPRAAATVLAALLTAFSPTSQAYAGGDANSILKNVEKGLISRDERALIKMKVVESNGAAKEREVEITRKSGAKNQVLVRLKAPSDVSGVALLSVSQGGTEDQWLYMPSQKKARRVVSGNKSQHFLDTEFNLEDFSAGTYSRFENSVVSEDRQPSVAVAVIESKAKSGDSSYSKIKTWVDLASYQVQKSEYYDKEGKLLKTMIFRDYKKFGTAWRAQTVEVRNMQTHRSTILKVAGMKLNTGINDREFTPSALENQD